MSQMNKMLTTAEGYSAEGACASNGFLKIPCIQTRYIFNFLFLFMSSLLSTPSRTVSNLYFGSSPLRSPSTLGENISCNSSFSKKYTRVLSPLAYRLGLRDRIDQLANSGRVEERAKEHTYSMRRAALKRNCVRSFRP